MVVLRLSWFELVRGFLSLDACLQMELERGDPGALEGTALTFIAFPFCWAVTKDFRGFRSALLRTLLQHTGQKFVEHSLERRNPWRMCKSVEKQTSDPGKA